MIYHPLSVLLPCSLSAVGLSWGVICEQYDDVCLSLIRRAVSSSSVDGICAMLNLASTVLEQDFREVLFGRVRAGFPSGFDLTQAYNMVQSSIQQGKLQSSDQEKAKTTFLVSSSKTRYVNLPLSSVLKFGVKFILVWFEDYFFILGCHE